MPFVARRLWKQGFRFNLVEIQPADAVIARIGNAVRPVARVLGLCLACGDPTGASGGVVERRVRPSETNPAISAWDADHYVWLNTSAAAAADRQLLVLLPGTGGAPRAFRLMGAIAAEQGYLAIGLMYPDDLAILQACTDEQDLTCMADMRSEIIEGADRSPYVNVDFDNSIDGRLAALLRHLAARYPAEGWSRFLSGDAPRWSAIAVGGLSQGGGHAAFIATRRPVPRVVMFGAPADGFQGRPAPWMAVGATPASRYFGLVHARDGFASIVPNWLALGLDAFGPLTLVEESAPPFEGAHMLTTDLLPATGSYGAAHASVFSDGATPRGTDGAPALEPAWRYLLGRPSGDPDAGPGPGPGPSRSRNTPRRGAGGDR
jgi:hypothetical protein